MIARRHCPVVVLASLGALPCLLSRPAAAQAPIRSTNLEIALTSSLFPNANQNETKAALRVWTSTLGRKRGFSVSPEVHVFDDWIALRKSILSGSVGLVALDTSEYARLSAIPSLETAFTMVRDEQEAAQRFLLLVRTDSGITSLEGLRGRRLLVCTNNGANLSQAWLETALQDARLGPGHRFFQSLELVSKPTSGILPVFFGKSDAVVVDAGSFYVAREMNPQLGSKLKTLASSQRVVESMLCFVAKANQYPRELYEAIRDAHLDPDARQIFLLLRARRFLPVDRPALDYSVQIWRKHQLLLAQQSAGSLVAGQGAQP